MSGWPLSGLPRCPLLCRCSGISGHQPCPLCISRFYEHANESKRGALAFRLHRILALLEVDRFHPTARQASVGMDRRQICNLWQCREEIHRASALRADENRSIVPGAKATHAHTRQRVRQHRFNKPWTHLRGNTDAYRKSAAQHHARCKEGRFLFTRRKARARTKPQQRSKVHTRRTTCISNVRWLGWIRLRPGAQAASAHHPSGAEAAWPFQTQSMRPCPTDRWKSEARLRG